ncbi:hypothetical protein A9Q99_26355 [Gammaproteobacteria bacterium 45_16_T64]|nr:hypothetical protein A9Q99_26355 [Gammaproteobacteria bacterium 45_16_T64]
MHKHPWLIITLLCALTIACDDTPTVQLPQEQQAPVTVVSPPADSALTEALTQFDLAKITWLSKTITCTEALFSEYSEGFLTSPSQESLTEQQHSLQQCLSHYLPLHYLLHSQTNANHTTLADAIYSVPIMPGYIDYLLAYPNSGIINDITVPLSAKTIRQQQGLTDSGEISLGFEVIAFLFQGEQRYNRSLAPRPVSDFAQEQERRRQYVHIALTLLIDDLTQLKTRLTMAENSINTATLNQREAKSIVTQILNSMLTGIAEDNNDELSVGFWHLLSYSQPAAETATIPLSLAHYLKWPKVQPDLSKEAFTAQLQASQQRLQEPTNH